MRTALWETSVGALAALLNSGAPLSKCDLYTVTLSNGTVLRWTNSESAFRANSQVWALGPGIERSRCKWTTGIEVDTLTIKLVTDTARPNLIAGMPLIAFIRAGGFAGATVQLDRCFWGAGDAGPVGALLWFVGRVADVPEIDRRSCTLSIKSELSRLNVAVPRDVFSAQCGRTVYDSECGVSRAAFTSTGAATSVSSLGRTQFSTGLAQAAGFFDLGTVTFISGANVGIKRTVKSHAAGGTLTVLSPLPAAVASGDSFSIVPGCDGLQATCTVKFNNLARFRGQPYIPQAETVA
jgi:uncharacterized phage protein (TIGR02218 family)